MLQSKRPLRAACLVGCLAAGGCFDFQVTAPPRTDGHDATPAIPASVITIPATVDAETVRGALEASLKTAPLADGESDEINAGLLVNEKSIIDEPRQIIKTPYRAAFCQIKKVPRQVTAHIKVGVETYGCLLNPFKWGSCWRDVFKDVTSTVFDDVKECFPEQAEVISMEMTPVVKFKESILPSSMRVRYRADLRSLDWRVSGDEITVSPATQVTVDVDLKQGVLGSDFTVRGALHCVSDVKPTGRAKFRLVEAGGRITPEVVLQDLTLDFAKVCIPGAVESADLDMALNPVHKLIVDQVAKAIEKKLVEKLNEQIEKAQGGIDLAAQVRAAAEAARQPIRLAEDVWLVPNAERLALSQITGGMEGPRPVLRMTASLVAHPTVRYGPKPVIGPLAPLSVGLGAAGGDFHLVPQGVIPLDAVTAKLGDALRDYVATLSPRYRSVRSTVQVYQSGAKLVFALGLSNVGPFRSSGTVYLTATPVFNPTSRQIELTDVKFDLASRELVLRWAAWLLDRRIEQYLEQRLKFPVGARMDDLLKQIADFKITSGAGVLSGKVTSVRLGSVWVANNSLNFTLVADGTSSFRHGA